MLAYLGLGSNIGDRRFYLHKAVELLDAHPSISVVSVSPYIETEPVGPVEQEPFLNGAAIVDTALGPMELLEAIHMIENKLGRTRGVRWGPRTVDIDILIYGELVMESEELTIPHPEMHRRDFVLLPLSMIAPELQVPGTGRTVSELYNRLLEKESTERGGRHAFDDR